MRMLVTDNVRNFMEENPQHATSLKLDTSWQMYKRVPDAISMAILDQAIKLMEEISGGKIKLVEDERGD